MRALLIAVVLVGGLGTTAEARRGGGAVIINTGDDILHIRDLPKADALVLADDPSSETLGDRTFFGKLGYRYERFGVFWMDIWRWDGEFVLYEGDTYVPLSDEMVEALGGASVPWRYRLPDGLLIVLALAYLGFIGRRKRSAKATLIIAGVLAVISAVLFFLGLTWEFGIPLVIAMHHALAARSAMKHAPPEEEAQSSHPIETSGGDSHASGPRASAKGTPPPVREPARDSGQHATLRSGEHAALPSRPSQPLVIERPSTAPAVVPMRADESVDGPKLLR